MKRRGMRMPSVSTTRAGPMATPGETGMPLLISIALLEFRPFGCLMSRGCFGGEEYYLLARGFLLFFIKVALKDEHERLHGFGGAGPGHFDHQLGSLGSVQPQQGEHALAVDGRHAG